jgi:diphthine-ammonia ligase
MILVGSWSGGKDSCLACYKAIKNGHRVEYLLNFISDQYKRCCFHGIEANLIHLQAELVGIPLIQKEVSPDMEKYETEFKAAVSEIKTKGIEGMVFGDVYLEEHRIWVERVCKDLEIVPIEPLWNDSALKVVEEFIGLGFQAIVVSCKADILGKDFVGRYLDKDLFQELQMRNICPCGENGEFHTFVIDGPMFKRRIEILESKPVLKEGFWRHWFLDIKRYK